MDHGPYKLFSSAKFLCDWVDEEIDLLETAINSFLSAEPYETRHDWDEMDRCWYIKMFEKQCLPNRVRGHASNIVKNLKHALDQAITSAAIALTDEVPKDVYFPLIKEKAALENFLRSKKCKILASLHPIVIDLESYYDGCRGQLANLGSVSGPHKHTQSLYLLPVLETANLGYQMAAGSYVAYKKPVFHREGGQVMMAYYTTDRQPIQISTYIAFETEVLLAGGALNYIRVWSKMVREAVNEIEEKTLPLAIRVF